jgi:hypothetical protein
MGDGLLYMGMETIKPTRKMKYTCVYLPEPLWREARSISDLTGIPVSRMCRDGMERQVARHRALQLLTAEGEQD